MDGVLCDFNKRYKELYNQEPGGEGRDKKDFSKNWKHFIETKQFETLEWFPGGKELLSFVESLNIPIEILSSSGGAKNHGEVRDQKRIWLAKSRILYPTNIVPGRGVKKFYAMPQHVLIDDTEDVIDAFNKANGVGILHKDVSVTIARLKEMKYADCGCEI